MAHKPTPEEDFGAHVRLAREARGWSQESLASNLRAVAGIDLHQTAVARLERGDRAIRFNEAAALASLLGIDLHGYSGMAITDADYDRTRAEFERLNEEEGQLRARLSALREKRIDEEAALLHELTAVTNFRWKLEAAIKSYEERQRG